MSSNNYWLHGELRKLPQLSVAAECIPLIIVSFRGRAYRIYTPMPDEYIVSVEVVEKVRELGGNLISYPITWCRASSEAMKYGQLHGIDVMPHSRLFEIFGR